MSSGIRAIQVDLIDADNEREELDGSFDDLVKSIRDLGLIQPIVVVPKNEGRYLVVCGRRRLRAMKTIGHITIDAVVGFDDQVHQEMATISENLHRLELRGGQRDEAILRYSQLLETSDSDKTLEDRDSSEPEVSKEDISVTAVAKAFGLGKETVRKAIVRAKEFTTPQRKVLDVAKISKPEIDLLASEEPETKKEVVNLVAAGFKFDEAMHDVLKDQGRVYLGVDSKLEEQEKVDSRVAKMPAVKKIKDAEAFRNDAILFWAVEDRLKKFLKEIDWKYKEEIAGGNPHGLFFRRLKLLADTAPPRLWQPCGHCQEKGLSADGCNYCRGGSYQIP